MNKKLYVFSQVVVFGLIVIGIVVVTITTHELKHYSDLEDGSVTDICILNLPTEYNGVKNFLFDNPIGYVRGEGESKELPANILMILVFILLLVIIKIFMTGDKSK